MNIIIKYMYRDGANYKQYSEIIVTNTIELSLDVITDKIKYQLIDGEYFIPCHWKLPALHCFLWDEDIDHHFHELIEINESHSDASSVIDIADIIKL